MSAAVVAVLNRKGGAGKTSLTKDLGFALADAGARGLQVGLDPQSSLFVKRECSSSSARGARP